MKLQEVENGYGISLKRVQDFPDALAESILKGQEQSGIVSWEPAAKNATVTPELPTPTEQPAQ